MANFQQDDRRLEERSPCDLPAKIVISGGQPEIACVVKNLSTTGAKIEVAEATRLPEEFDLLVPAVPGADQKFRVRIQWREQDYVGGEFL